MNPDDIPDNLHLQVGFEDNIFPLVPMIEASLGDSTSPAFPERSDDACGGATSRPWR